MGGFSEQNVWTRRAPPTQPQQSEGFSSTGRPRLHLFDVPQHQGAVEF
jgi:hypothetical protein